MIPVTDITNRNMFITCTLWQYPWHLFITRVIVYDVWLIWILSHVWGNYSDTGIVSSDIFSTVARTVSIIYICKLLTLLISFWHAICGTSWTFTILTVPLLSDIFWLILCGVLLTYSLWFLFGIFFVICSLRHLCGMNFVRYTWHLFCDTYLTSIFWLRLSSATPKFQVWITSWEV